MYEEAFTLSGILLQKTLHRAFPIAVYVQVGYHTVHQSTKCVATMNYLCCDCPEYGPRPVSLYR